MGTEEWRSLVGKSDAEAKVIDLYCDHLEVQARDWLGQDVLAYPVKFPAFAGRGPYCLVLVTHHPLGRYAMEQAFLQSQQEASAKQVLFARPGTRDTCLETATRLGATRALEIADVVWKADRHATWFFDIRHALRELHQDGFITVTKQNGERRSVNALPEYHNLIAPTGKTRQQESLF